MGIGHGALGMGHWALGMEHGALDSGRCATKARPRSPRNSRHALRLCCIATSCTEARRPSSSHAASAMRSASAWRPSWLSVTHRLPMISATRSASLLGALRSARCMKPCAASGSDAARRSTPRAWSSRARSSSAEAPAPPPSITSTDSLLLRRLGDSSALSSGALALAGSRLVFLSRRRRPFSSPRGVGSRSEASGGVLRPLGGGERGGRLEDLDTETRFRAAIRNYRQHGALFPRWLSVRTARLDIK